MLNPLLLLIATKAAEAIARYGEKNWRWGERTVTLEEDTKEETHASKVLPIQVAGPIHPAKPD